MQAGTPSLMEIKQLTSPETRGLGTTWRKGTLKKRPKGLLNHHPAPSGSQVPQEGGPREQRIMGGVASSDLLPWDCHDLPMPFWGLSDAQRAAPEVAQGRQGRVAPTRDSGDHSNIPSALGMWKEH